MRKLDYENSNPKKSAGLPIPQNPQGVDWLRVHNNLKPKRNACYMIKKRSDCFPETQTLRRSECLREIPDSLFSKNRELPNRAAAESQTPGKSDRLSKINSNPKTTYWSTETHTKTTKTSLKGTSGCEKQAAPKTVQEERLLHRNPNAQMSELSFFFARAVGRSSTPACARQRPRTLRGEK